MFLAAGASVNATQRIPNMNGGAVFDVVRYRNAYLLKRFLDDETLS